MCVCVHGHICLSVCLYFVYVCVVEQVAISENVEKWLSSLMDCTHETIGSLMHDIVLECGALSVDDCASKVYTYVIYIRTYIL